MRLLSAICLDISFLTALPLNERCRTIHKRKPDVLFDKEKNGLKCLWKLS